MKVRIVFRLPGAAFEWKRRRRARMFWPRRSRARWAIARLIGFFWGSFYKPSERCKACGAPLRKWQRAKSEQSCRVKLCFNYCPF